MKKKWIKEKYEDIANKFNMNYRAYYMRVHRLMLKGHSEEAANKLVKEKLIKETYYYTPTQVVHSPKVIPVVPKITNIQIHANEEGTMLTTNGVLASYNFKLTKNLSHKIYMSVMPLLMEEFNKCN